MRNRRTTEIWPLVFEHTNDSYSCSDKQPVKSEYQSATHLSMQEKLQIARDAISFALRNHHEGSGEFEDKLEAALKALE